MHLLVGDVEFLASFLGPFWNSIGEVYCTIGSISLYLSRGLILVWLSVCPERRNTNNTSMSYIIMVSISVVWACCISHNTGHTLTLWGCILTLWCALSAWIQCVSSKDPQHHLHQSCPAKAVDKKPSTNNKGRDKPSEDGEAERDQKNDLKESSRFQSNTV